MNMPTALDAENRIEESESGAAQQKAVMLAHPLVVARLGREDHGDKERRPAAFIPCRCKYFLEPPGKYR